MILLIICNLIAKIIFEPIILPRNSNYCEFTCFSKINNVGNVPSDLTVIILSTQVIIDIHLCQYIFNYEFNVAKYSFFLLC